MGNLVIVSSRNEEIYLAKGFCNFVACEQCGVTFISMGIGDTLEQSIPWNPLQCNNALYHEVASVNVFSIYLKNNKSKGTAFCSINSMGILLPLSVSSRGQYFSFKSYLVL